MEYDFYFIINVGVFMTAKDILILILIVALFGTLIFGSLGNFFGAISTAFSGVSDTVDNTGGYVSDGGYSKGIASDASSSGSSSGGSSGSKSSSGYEDYQYDYETNMTDAKGNMIYLSIVSTSGGQMEPGIYQVYWSALGVINQTRIG